MKARQLLRRSAAVSFLLLNAAVASAVTFTTDTYISATNFSNDGQDIVVTNCTLTVDGPHGFNSIEVQNAGVLTHSAFTNGPQQSTNSVSDEMQTLRVSDPAVLLNTNVDTNTIVVMDVSGSITYTQNVDYVVLSSPPYTVLELTTNSAIAEGTNVLVSYNWLETYQGFSLMISNNAQVLAGGAVNLAGKGYAGGSGPGAGMSGVTNYPFTFTAGGGGGYGGSGGMSSTSGHGGGGGLFDFPTNPVSIGSGGGTGSSYGGAGGGFAQFFVGGTLQVDGAIVADGLNGTNAHSGGGSGGGLLLSAQTFSGAGTITVNGGAGDSPDGGGGGGGRIAIYYTSNSFAGDLSAFGGGGAQYGGAGTIFIRSFTSPVGQLLIVNAGTPGTNTLFPPSGVGSLTISGGAIAPSLYSTFAISNLFIGSNSSLLSPGVSPLTLTVNGDATVQSSGAIDASFASAVGPGAGGLSCNAGTGGGYGGFGGPGGTCGRIGGTIYGSTTQPVALGSSGGAPGVGAPGGGAINLTVTGTLSLAGKIAADGAPTSPGSANGAGSGGSVWLTVGTLAGNGLITANGGAADPFVGGGGGGGRVAVYFNTNQFTGSTLAHGGSGAGIGGPGTVYVMTNGAPFGQLTIDNAGLQGITAFPSALSPVDLTISGGSTVSNFDGSTVSLRNLLIGSNSSFTPSSATLTINASNATIQAGGTVTTDGDSNGGPGGGGSGLNGGGGGNAGYGGAGTSNAPGGIPTGSITLANTVGGSGGDGGGKGGGVVSLTVGGTLQLDGAISADGLAGLTQNSGGGAGGSISLTVGTLSGAGTLLVNGGTGNNIIGGGGSGGYLTIHYATNQFVGFTQAHGGTGANAGGAGVIYFAGNSNQLIVLDNGGSRGAATPLLGTQDALRGTAALTVTGGAILTNFSAVTLSNLFIGSNSTVLAASALQLPPLIYTFSNATIQASGNFSADGGGVSGIIAQSFNSTGGGGGYGGMGGNSASNALGGGSIFDSFTSPSSVGGRGGSGLNGLLGGNGGGNLRISVNGKLQLDGAISSQGLSGPGLNSGGGAGGSIDLASGTLAGSGLLSVNGGAANGPAGGGGGGGRIALYYNSNSFTGRFTAYGGAGANYGGAGTIYVNPSLSGSQAVLSQFIIDNGGAVGNTILDTYPSGNLDLTLLGDATVSFETTESIRVENFYIGSNSTFAVPVQQSITVLTNLTIQPGAKLTDDGASANIGGQTLNATGGGGGHGGYGGASLSNALGGTALLDSVSQPSQAGTRGGAGALGAVGGNGGGLMTVTVNGTLQLDGRLSSDGLASTAFNGGGGSGGGMMLTLGSLAGAGTLSASGGAGNNVGGGGGGGRIAVFSKSNLFAGILMARGGAGGNYGGAGTIYLAPNPSAPSSLFPELIVDNGGNRGTNTLLTGISSLTDVSIDSGAALALSASFNTWRSLTIASNGTLGGIPGGSGNALAISITGNANIQPGGAITFDGGGFDANVGFGPGYNPSPGGGGGHGGDGSSGAALNDSGGAGYDSISSPSQAGTGGGAPGLTSGSAGGGALQLTVNGTLTVNGPITANGMPANTNGAGGGAGGSLLINAGTLAGSAKISADGGNGDLLTSGGGGGGRIALYFNSDAFTGAISARGGAGVGLAGGAGTIYLKTNSASVGQLIVDNAGSAGTNTPLSSLSSTVALVLRNSAQADSTNPLTLQTLSINSAAAFNGDSLAPLNLTVLGDALVDTNGSIIADAAGYSPAAGPGSGGVDGFGDGGGGGYGGAGGSSLFGAAGGGTYGSLDQPTDFGSAGGTVPTVDNFSQGGGAIRLVVNGKLTVSGIISADGNNGFISGSGGGSGGSIWITTSIFSGKGLITANGGAGESGDGGGGGGGRIAINPATNFFEGFAVAFGGGGATPGEDGTVLVAPTFVISGSVLDTNGAPVAGITLQPSGLASVTSDAAGFYSITVPPIWSGSVTPTGTGIFLPNVLSYSGVSANATNQNFLVALPSSFNFTGSEFDGTNNAGFSWYGINGVTYQPLCSSNLLDWTPYGSPIIGTNGPAIFQVPVANAPQLFFRLSVTY